ncbi:HAD-IIA family hydrolase [Nocardia amikacinitolerans]|uniref:HAD-IIA family hydrolase n=1 Tax=Nocardia amikacinitolerans TaxID=756689 RepID=UPI0020A43363|nr:HAD-IIA family hydrolase [Nocardia amikacinitolerans]MCP2289008.1 Haloacid Dehalogenase Superfamily Class (subfamily) IIA [Nocardia amikacinitolerans]
MKRLRDRYEALLLDLDGTLYRGPAVIEGAPEALAGNGGSEQRLVYVTNNASRGPEVVAEHLADLGFPATAEDVVTSAQAAARLLAERLRPGAEVLVVGTDDLVAEVDAVGLRGIRRFDGTVPAAVVQGHSPQTAWPDLAEAAYALRADALWVAANTDKTLPNERGLAPGNGAMVAALRAASDREPIVAGKPYAPLLEDALVRAGTRSALVVGDRMDTDIEGAQRVGLESLLVLTGVSTLDELRTAPETRIPTYVAESLDALNHPPVDDDSTDDLSERLRRNPGRAVTVRAPGSEIR